MKTFKEFLKERLSSVEPTAQKNCHQLIGRVANSTTFFDELIQSLDDGCSVDSTDGDDTIITAMILNQDYTDEQFKKVLSYSPDVDHLFPLHRSAKFGNIAVMGLLIDAGADVNLLDNNGKRFDFYLNKHRDGVKEFLKKYLINERLSSVKPSDYNNDPEKIAELRRAVFKQDIETVKSLLDEGVNPNAKDDLGDPVLFRALVNSDREILQAFLKHGYDINLMDNYKNTVLTKYMDVRERNKSNLSLVFIDDLLKAGADANHIKSATPLLTKAILDDDYKLLNLFLKYHPDINAMSGVKNTPLMTAVLQDQVPMTELLLKHNPDLTIKSKFGQTAIEMMEQRDAFKEVLRNLKV